MQTLRVLLIASDPLARSALAALVNGADVPIACAIVGRSDGSETWEQLVALHSAEIILCDLGWQASLELDDLRELGCPVVALAGDAEAAQAVWQAGAMAVLERDVSAESLLLTLQTAALGLHVFSPERLPDTLNPTVLNQSELIEPLTPREHEVLDRLALGLTNRAIALQLQISDHTVKFHVNSLLTKLNAQSRTEAAVKATRLGLLSI